MPLVLGIDASWTAMGTTGVALVDTARGLVAVAPSYESFVARSLRTKADRVLAEGAIPDVEDLIKAATDLGGASVDVVAVDMPMARKPITRRRTADDAVSRAFGAHGAGVHSPTAIRPGPYGESLTRAFISAGFPLITEPAEVPVLPALIEVFPLAALVRLMRLPKRPCYKISKTTRYWPTLNKTQRLHRLRTEWKTIICALQCDVENIAAMLPNHSEEETFAALKPYEDMIDATVCAWIGAQYVAGRAEAFGNANASIWIPCIQPEP